jgi:hypothetical protein
LRTAVALLILLATSPLNAAELPAVFHGTWRIANPTDSTCRKDDVKGAAEGHITVTATEVDQYESSCRIASARPTRRGDREPFSVAVDLRCSGEGMRWRNRTLWHLETVDGKKIIALTTLSHRQRGGRRGNPADRNALPNTALYVECR